MSQWLQVLGQAVHLWFLLRKVEVGEKNFQGEDQFPHLLRRRRSLIQTRRYRKAVRKRASVILHQRLRGLEVEEIEGHLSQRDHRLVGLTTNLRLGVPVPLRLGIQVVVVSVEAVVRCVTASGERDLQVIVEDENINVWAD